MLVLHINEIITFEISGFLINRGFYLKLVARAGFNKHIRPSPVYEELARRATKQQQYSPENRSVLYISIYCFGGSLLVRFL